MRFYTHPHPPMLVPAAPDAGPRRADDWGDAAVILAPELEQAR